jgi:anaerobic magnesium-protoporphyrin IX monomethyl ester cyclase
VDAVVLGEGEETAVELVRCFRSSKRAGLDTIPGIAFRSNGQVHVTDRRERIADLDQLPLPGYSKLNMADYRLVNIVSARGCPFKCTFCDVAPMWQRRNLRRSVDSVVDEIILLRDTFGTRRFEFSDETFVLDRRRVLALCDRLRREQLGVEWACTGRVDLMTPELLDTLCSAGCRAVFYGVESGSDSVLERIKKEFTARQAVEVILETRKRMHVVASFIWGFPEESREDFLKTIFLLLDLEQHGVDARLNRLSPFSLTTLFAQHRNELIWLEDRSVHSGHDPFQLSALRPDVAKLVRSHPGVFPEFWWLPSPQLTEKVHMVGTLGRHRHTGAWPAAPGGAP